MDFILVQGLAGLASAALLFLIASGLTLIFGVTRIVNFAHGSLYMLGAYVGVSVAPVAGFWPAALAAALAVGALGLALETALLRRLYDAPALFQLVATFGLVLIAQDAVLWIWGPDDRIGPRAPGFRGTVHVAGQAVPAYDLALIAIGLAVLGLLWLALTRTRWGMLVRAATEDRVTAAALGIDERLLFRSVVGLGTALAGLAGALALPRQPASLGMDAAVIVDAFVVTVIGGLGSIPGAFLAAVLIGEVQAFGIALLPGGTLAFSFATMAAVLVLRPAGLLGERRPEPERRAVPARPLTPLSTRGRAAALAGLGLLALAPLGLGPYGLSVLAEVLIFAIFAASLHFMLGVGGMVTFGHAAWFGLGAYGAALAAKAGAGMLPALAAGIGLATAAAIVFGAFCVRLSGVYLAMLTLAIAQLCHAVAFQSYGLTGGDDGILGIRADAWVGDPGRFFGLALALAALAWAGLRHLVFSPFGTSLRAVHDAPERAEALGLSARRLRWIGFAVAAGAAGLAGGLFAYAKGSVFPDVLGIPVSVDGLVMVLLGGVQSLAGPLVGAAIYKLLQILLAAETNHWRAWLGAAIVLLAAAFPAGLAGLGDSVRRWVRPARATR